MSTKSAYFTLAQNLLSEKLQKREGIKSVCFIVIHFKMVLYLMKLQLVL